MQDKKGESKSRFEPDIRFLLANERTLLAWIRTSIALQAGGLVLAHFSSNAIIQRVASVLIVGLGGWTAYIGYSRFKAADNAIRSEQLPSIGYAPPIQAGSVIIVAIVLILGILLGVR
ncbi:MAG: YidH family protein [Candidatus Saccharimonadales bacterium]